MKEVRNQSPQATRRGGKSEVRIQNREYRRISTKNIFFCLCSLFSFLFSSLPAQANPAIPEKLGYSLYWSGIKAGDATLEVENNPAGIRIVSCATSADFISLFYRVEDVVQSYLYQDGFPKNYRMKLREGRHRRDKEVEFGDKIDNGVQKIIYRNKLDNKTEEFNSEKKAFDPLSGFYAIRKRNLKVGQSEYIDVFDSKKFWSVEVQVLRKERISMPAGEFDTIVIKPILQSEGIFIKKGEVHIWLTDDDRKIPVMMKSKIKIGSIIAKLVSIN